MKKYRIISMFLLSFVIIFSSLGLIRITAAAIHNESLASEQIAKTIDNYYGILLTGLAEKKASFVEAELNSYINIYSEKGKELFNYETGKIDYIIESHNIGGISIENFDYSIEFTNIEIIGERAHAKLR